MESTKVMVEFTLNGKAQKVAVKPTHTLLKVLRDTFGFKGTKASCEKGECGACTVLLDGRAVNSCLVLAPEVDGRSVVTIEDLNKDNKLDPIQEAFLEEGAVQCGFCTPGMIMAAKALLDENPDPEEREIKEALAGNLCRCTGYTRIIGAVSKAAQKRKGAGAGER
ncbi:MAG: (2Fe-2S)-binding protein [Peptococcaceae bacterium]|jgi:carbon-monoxide dehydrogenase small subunit|nr:(2Fe-2S)-binding protein [Peptococcaceae bacterium]MDH7524809.1 (2Fe-2S)-binding protein [Peptococcaceae bacterium]